MSDDTADRREHLRRGVNQEFAELDGMFSEYVSNISVGGVFLRCDVDLPLGTEVQLNFTVLLDDFEKIEGRGVVVRSNAPENGGLGIRILELTPRSEEVVAAVCDEQDEPQ